MSKYERVTAGAPYFIMNSKGELLCSVNRNHPSFFSRQWHSALNYDIKQSAWCRLWAERKRIKVGDAQVVPEAQVKETWAILDKESKPAPAPSKEPEVLTVPEQETDRYVGTPFARDAVPVPAEPEPVDESRNELLMGAMQTELALMSEEATAYEMWQIAAVKLRNHKMQREFLEHSSKRRH